MIVIRYWDEVLEPHVCLFMGVISPAFVLMDDNARHIELIWSINSQEREDVHMNDWPIRSPELIPMQHACLEYLRLSNCNFPPRTIESLKT
ncbi:hypothetical protein TNCV_3673401 [Trichonephila clavipes]|nr:hypothetical protein TNCV_3673401 [Trichonephila clavipes]